VIKSFTNPGTYDVKLTNLFSICLDSVVKRIVVIGGGSSVDFTTPIPEVVRRLSRQILPIYQPVLSHGPGFRRWFSLSYQQNPSHTYT
jgi:PKD repeat protein